MRFGQNMHHLILKEMRRQVQLRFTRALARGQSKVTLYYLAETYNTEHYMGNYWHKIGNTVGPHLIGPIGTEDFQLYLRITFKKR